MSSSSANEPILSPCIGVCTLDGEDFCIGCHRNAEEIAVWGQLSRTERERVMAELEWRAQRQGL